MKVSCIRVGVFLMGIISMLSFMTGCSNQGVDSFKGKLGIGSTVELSEGATLTGLYMSHQGMARGPYYIFRVIGDNSYMKITSEAPDGYYMTRDDDYSEVLTKAKENRINTDISVEEEIQYFRFVDEVRDCEHASLVNADETIIGQLTDAINQSEAMSWNGYAKHRTMKHVSDSGDGYYLFLVFSDGSTVKVSGYNAHPDGWNDFFANVRSIFEENADYSRYDTADDLENEGERR